MPSRTSFVPCALAAAFMLTPAAFGQGNSGGGTPPPQEGGVPVKVYFLLGQSNMVGFGDIGISEPKEGSLADLVINDGMYVHMRDDDGWVERDDVWVVKTTVGQKQGWLKPGFGARDKFFGPELQFGHVLGEHHDEPVLIIKASQGNRSLGWDILPPGSEEFEHDGKMYAGYGDSTPSWIPGEEKTPVDWYAGKQYDDFVRDMHEVLDDLSRFFPSYQGQGYEVAGFGWWQGHKDQNAAHASRYEQNMVKLIETLREEFDAPNAPFAIATIGFGGDALSGHGLTVLEAQMAMNDEEKYPQFKGNVKAVDMRPFWRAKEISPSGQGHHYNHHAETYMEAGNALGEAMVEMLGDE